MACTCAGCGDKYRVDLVVPNEVWDKITGSREVLLCGKCIMERIEWLGEYDYFHLVKLDGIEKKEPKS